MESILQSGLRGALRSANLPTQTRSSAGADEHFQQGESVGYNSSRKSRVASKRRKIAASRKRKIQESLAKKKS